MTEHVDILIVGAGPVGMTLHCALAAGGQKSLLIDRRPQSALQADPRRWRCRTVPANCSNRSTPAGPRRDADRDHPRVAEGRLRPHADRPCRARLPALGYVVRYRDLAAALAARIEPGALIAGAEIIDTAPDDDGVRVLLRDAGGERELRCRLLVHAEGTPGDDPAVTVSDYAQHAVICEVTPEPGHGRRAWERFTPDGPLALLPLGDEYSVVFTLPPAKADAVMALDDAAFAAALQAQFGRRCGCRGPARAAASRLRCAAAGRWSTAAGVDRQLRADAASGLRPGLQPRPARRLATAEILLADGVDPRQPRPYAASRRLDRAAAHCSPTVSSACSRTTARR
jgi:2-octaprenyl-6-methoxyphenol hydroxylase